MTGLIAEEKVGWEEERDELCCDGMNRGPCGWLSFRVYCYVIAPRKGSGPTAHSTDDDVVTLKHKVTLPPARGHPASHSSIRPSVVFNHAFPQLHCLHLALSLLFLHLDPRRRSALPCASLAQIRPRDFRSGCPEIPQRAHLARRGTHAWWL